jgi:methylated-DNA-protein-cysteine methyltransferase-like protein
VPDQWTQGVYAIVRQIPRGRVATYGLIGMLAGRPLAARAVGNAMRTCADASVPCYRVVRSTGEPAFARHGTRLRSEGVRFVGARVDLSRSLWRPRLRGD